MDRIDIKAIIADKLKKKARFIPGFLIRFIEWLLCIDKINYVIDNLGNRDPLGFIEGTLDYIGVKYRLHGAENIAGLSRVVFAANHPLGGLDGLIMAHAMDSMVGHTKFIVNDILMYIKPLDPIFVPVNKHGGQSAGYARGLNELFESESSIIVFPAGLCSRLINGKITDLEWKRNFLQKAFDYSRPVVPVFISGRNSMSFYRLEQFRRRLGIKFNIGMIFLPKEMFAQKGATIDIYIGKPVYSIKQDKTIQDTVLEIREMVYNMAPDK